MIPFNVKKHSDITITVSGDGGGAAGGAVPSDERTFHLHKFPLISKSLYFDEHIPDTPAAIGPTEMIIRDFPGGPGAFETVAKYCYGIDIELTVDNIAAVYCAARVLRVPDLERSTDAFMAEVVLRDPAKAAVVLKVATGIANMTDAMMEGLVGHCINAIASMFAPLPELNALPSDCFSCVVRAARDMEANKRTLEVAVASYLESHVSEVVLPTSLALATAASAGGKPGGSATNVIPPGAGGAPRLSVEEFLDVVAAPGRMDDMRHAEIVYSHLETMLRTYKSDEQAEALCKGLHELGLWVCLPHSAIERAYSDRNVPDRYCTVALMAENRHLLKVNEQLAEQCETLSEALRAHSGGAGVSGGALTQ